MSGPYADTSVDAYLSILADDETEREALEELLRTCGSLRGAVVAIKKKSLPKLGVASAEATAASAASTPLAVPETRRLTFWSSSYDEWRLRSAPHFESQTLGALSKGAVVNATVEDGDWLYVTIEEANEGGEGPSSSSFGSASLVAGWVYNLDHDMPVFRPWHPSDGDGGVFSLAGSAAYVPIQLPPPTPPSASSPASSTISPELLASPGFTTAPFAAMTFDQQVQAAIDASMREAPGGAAAGPTFLEALRVDGDVRRERRTRIADRFAGIVDVNQAVTMPQLLLALSLADGCSATERLPRYGRDQVCHAPGCGPYPLSELIYYLRYVPGAGAVTPAEADVLAIPGRDSPYFSGFQIYLEVERSRKAAWARIVQSKLEDVTACGHFADTMLRTVYFSGAEAASAAADTISENSKSILKRTKAFAKRLRKEPERSFVVRMEVSSVHVYLLDIPGVDPETGVRPPAHVVESIRMSVDVNISGAMDIDDVIRHISFRDADWCDVFTIHPYDPANAADRLRAAVINCFGAETLDQPFAYGTDRDATWNDGLEYMYRLKASYDALGRGVWFATRDYL